MGELLGFFITVISTLTSLFLTVVVLRFLLQMTRADPYNPVSQSILKMTNWALLPLRRVVPGLFGIDLASIVLALLIQIVFGEIVSLIAFQKFYNPANLLIWGTISTLVLVTYIGYGCLIIMVISSFIAPHSHHPILVLVHQLMEPILRPIRNTIPPVGMFDFSVLIAFLMLGFIRTLLSILAKIAEVHPLLVIGI